MTTMNKIGYIIVYSVLWLIALIPLRILLSISWPLYFILYYIIQYRKKVVFTNLKNSFPEKPDKEIQRIAKRFYLHLCDIFIETFYSLNMGIKEALRRYTVSNIELMNELKTREENLIFISNHYANWEWANIPWTKTESTYSGVYKPLSNKIFDRLMITIREKHGSITVPMKNTLRFIFEMNKKNKHYMLYLISDQRPMKSEIQYWSTFLNQDTPFLTGPEKLAKKFNIPVVFVDVNKIKRGYYEVTYRIITDNPKETKEFEITEKYIRLIEEQIKRKPEYYLWSHKRWKHKRVPMDVEP